MTDGKTDFTGQILPFDRSQIRGIQEKTHKNQVPGFIPDTFSILYIPTYTNTPTDQHLHQHTELFILYSPGSHIDHHIGDDTHGDV